MWKDITEFPRYEVNHFSQVRNKKTKRILKHWKNKKGYCQLFFEGRCRKIHRLSAIEFIKNPLGLETINHKDGNKDNNHISNLEWMSRSENVTHSFSVLNIKRVPYSKSNKKHHLLKKFGENSNAGKKIIAELENGKETVFGSSCDAARILFNKPELGKMIIKYINLNKKYRNIKFKRYESGI